MRVAILLNLIFLALVVPRPAQAQNDHGAEVKESLDRARALYPESVQPDSPLSRAILSRIEWLGQNNQGYFSDPDWPVKITAREALALGIRAVAPARPVASSPNAPARRPQDPGTTRYLAAVKQNFSVVGASFRKNQQIVLESVQDYGKRGTTLVDGQPVLLWLDKLKIIKELPPGEPDPIVVKVISARYGPPGRAGYSVSRIVQSLISPDAEGRYEILVSDALLTPGAASTLNRANPSLPPFDPYTGQPNVQNQNILTVTYSINGIPKTKQVLEGKTLILD